MTKKKTHEEFISQVKELVANEYEFLETYVNADYKIKMKHSKCGRVTLSRPADFLRGTRCRLCAFDKNADTKRRTIEEFREEVKELSGDEYEVLGEYVNSGTRIRMLHKSCHQEFDSLPSGFLIGYRCPACSYEIAGKKRRVGTERFKKRMKEMVGDEYTLLSEYEKTDVPVLVRHEECGYEWKTKPNHFSNGNRCPRCSGRERITQEIFLDRIAKIHGSEYEVLENIVHTKEKVLVKHVSCGYEWKTQPTNFLCGRTCPKCAGKIKMTTELFKEKIEELVSDEYTLAGEVSHSKEKVLVLHNECGRSWAVSPNNFMKGTRCKHCRSSKGEKAVQKALSQLNLEYKTEYKFADCRSILPLPFDFAVFEDSKLICLIEYHGLQHYKPVEYWGGVETLLKVQERDAIKKGYCKNNKIPFIEIPYTEKDIEGFLVKWLNALLNEQLKLSF